MGHGVTGSQPVKVRKQNWSVIKTMSSPALVGSNQRPHKGEKLTGALKEGWGQEFSKHIRARPKGYCFSGQ